MREVLEDREPMKLWSWIKRVWQAAERVDDLPYRGKYWP
jgi:hypothetical protein